MPAGVLYVVATPIGNLDDFSLRAVETLRRVRLIAAEDTRHSAKLLARHRISAELVALHEHNEEALSETLAARLLAGESIALISDAGTPLISDPGYRLVSLAQQSGIRVSPVPGASAVTAALSVCGLATDRFVFEGFLPAKSNARRSVLEKLRAESRTMVFFESSHRIVAALQNLAEVLGASRRGSVCRELTKQFETVLRGSLAELAETVARNPEQRKGEFVVVVEGGQPHPDEQLTQGLELAKSLIDYLPASQAAKIAAKISGAPRRAVYEALLND